MTYRPEGVFAWPFRDDAWEHCHIGSCQRHQDCMYRPCRASIPEQGHHTHD